MSKVDVQTRRTIRASLKRIREIDKGGQIECLNCHNYVEISGIKELEKEKEKLRSYLKELAETLGIDFDYPEGRTEWVNSLRKSYDYTAIEEMIESGLIDSDTAAIIRRARKETEVRSFYIR